MRSTVTGLALLLAGCGFEHGALSSMSPADAPPGTVDARMIDGAIDSPPGVACTPGFLDLCAQTEPTDPLMIAAADTINTDTDSRCRTLTQSGGAAVCLVYATTFSITSSGSLTVTGSRPLAIAATSTLAVDGAIDVSSQRASGQTGPAADNSSCAVTTPAEDDAGGAGGGAGGSFGTAGGNGGTGDTNLDTTSDQMGVGGQASGPATITVLRGGCRGEKGGDAAVTAAGGAGGHSGGALYLYAHDSASVAGVIRATGAGGNGGTANTTSGGGGGGGGTGGMVVIESPSIMIGGQISANGGGAGEGGFLGGGSPRNGLPGADGALDTTPAAGGHNTNYTGTGTGGAGAAGSTAATGGGQCVAGGGGGGGGAGKIKLIGSSTVTGTVSPPAS
jgi:hypothetical protein